MINYQSKPNRIRLIVLDLGTLFCRRLLLHWNVIETTDQELLSHLIDVLNVSPIVAKILINRGIQTYDEAKKFFRPDWDDLYDPFLMKDMEIAVKRLIAAKENDEKVLVYGDYDVDGITSVSLLYLFLKSIHVDVEFYIPDRLKEGYGLANQGIKKAADQGVQLLISVDCGITAIDEVQFANQLGVDVIVSDHHEPSEVLPKAIAVVDPKREDCGYPFKELAGVGVAFKLIQAVSQALELEDSVYREYIDLVALGSAADIVPLVDENRVLVNKGIEKLNMRERIGLRALIESSGLGDRILGTGQVVFILAPRINAVGRMGNAERAVRLLITESAQKARNIASILESENRTRKSIDEMTFLEALEFLEWEYNKDQDKAVVLANDGWHSGVIGIVASRIVEHIHRPTVMIAIEDGVGKGSARSIQGFDIYSAIQQCEHNLLGFGGHKYAAGLTIDPEKIQDFKNDFKSIAAETLNEEDMVKKLAIDSEITLPEIDDKMVRILNQFAPFGPQNMRPVFCAKNCRIVGSPKIVGKNHLKFRVAQGDKIFDAIGFDLGNLEYRLTPGEDSLNIAFVVDENHWNGETKVQLRIKDLN